MTQARPPKKSETLEIRLSQEAKQAFMARCQREGRTASEVLRDHIDTGRARPGLTNWRRHGAWQAGIAALSGLVLGALAGPSLAQAEPGSRAGFDRLDANHDGVVSFEEYRGG